MGKKSKSPARRAMSKKSDSTDAERFQERFMVRWSTFRDLGSKVVIGGFVSLTAYVTFYLPLTVAPGKTTVITQTTEFLAKFDLHVWMAWGTAAAATAGWWHAQNKRVEEREERDKRLRDFEAEIDPTITSSELNAEGTGPKETPK